MKSNIVFQGIPFRIAKGSGGFSHARVEEIRSLQNPRIKALVRLREGSHRRRQGRFLVEGRREIERALASGMEFEEFFHCPDFFRDPADNELVAAAMAATGEYFLVSPEAFRKASYREGPDGFLAVAKIWKTEVQELELPENPFLLVVEKVEKPGNLGTLLRTADAAGIDAVIVADPVVDVFNPNAIRASQGAFFSMPIAVTENTTCALWLEEQGIRAVATTPGAESELWDVDLSGPIALLLGSEAEGLSDFWLRETTVETARIPMAGQGDSLNVSAAAAVFLFEAVRQRRG